MVTRTRTVDLLPEIFRTDTNKKFLSATLDQMVQPSKLQRVEGFIGKKNGPGVNSTDSYVIEPDTTRANYQLEPSVVYKVPNTATTKDLTTYPGLIDALNIRGAKTNKHDRLFSSEFYSWDPFVDYDKFINFSQYHWLSGGPDSVNVQATEIGFTNDFTVDRTTSGYTLSGSPGTNPTITLIRGGNYTFTVEQNGNPFWIQANPGTSGTLIGQENISSQDVLGVTNNGTDNGTVTFNVPLSTAQDEFYSMTDLGEVDLTTDLRFDQINNVYVDVFLAEHKGIDSISDLENRTVIFLNKNTDPDGSLSGWRFTDRFDSTTSGYDSEVFDSTVDITTTAERYGVWKIQFQTDPSDPTRPFMVLSSILDVPNLSKFEVQYGTKNASRYFYKSAEGFFEPQPLLTATRDLLYYQDQNDATKFGVIKVVDELDSTVLDVDTDIVGKVNYTSPNGVVFTNGLKVQFRGKTEPTSYQDEIYYIEGVGTAIQLLPETNFQTPEPFLDDETLPFDITSFDSGPFDSSLNSPKDQDYFTINKASLDLNPWTRTNRWTHIDVINKTAEYNNTVTNLDQTLRAKRPILEFKAGLRLFNFGTEGKAPINIIDFNQTDALSNVNGKTGYSLDGYSLVNGTRIVFANDLDPEVRNKIYEVTLIDEDGLTSTDKIINLTQATDGAVAAENTVYLLSGSTLQGKSYRYTGNTWTETQQKTKVNQAPLFDIFDKTGKSLSDQITYPSTNFIGSKLFSYAPGSGALDTVLNQRLKYLSINNVGDIVFDNNLESDTFIFTSDSVSTTSNISIGFAHTYSTRTTFAKELGWKKHLDKSIQSQVIAFTYADVPLVCDIPAKAATDNAVVIFVDNVFYNSSKYTFVTTTDQTTITFATDHVPTTGANIEVRIISDNVSKTGFYQIPDNLANNSPNNTFSTITLGTVRNHYVDLAQNIPTLSGTVLGINNIRDLGDVVPYGNKIVQQGSPLELATTFVRDSNINFFDALAYAGTEYEKYKNKIIDAVTKNDFVGTTAQKLDQALKFVNASKELTQPFYWTDTIPCGDVFTETTHTITAIDDEFFDLTTVYDFTKANYQGLLVYKNDVQLIKDIDYTVATDGARLTIHDVATGLATLVSGDVVKIREYTTTYGSYVPSTPTKLGLYKKYKPEIYSDDSYITTTNVIVGHDGSKVLAFDDDRDSILLEFEKRIYNNIKWTGDVPLCVEDVSPGKFRTTEYTEEEITEILGTSFLTWVSWNRLDYKVQDYDADEKRTWNYSKADDTIDGELLPGHWRGAFNKYYDTDLPHLTPWEMIGFSEKPIWWVSKYGPAPYTSGNTVLWDDLAAGRIWDGTSTYSVDTKFIRTNLTTVIPVTDEGALKTPFDTMVKNYDNLSLEKSWVQGDQGPVESAWRKSSAYPFAIMRLLALTKPAEFFALNADRDLYKFDTDLGQHLYNGRTRIKSSDISVYGENNSKHSYINWSVDFARKQGISTSTEIADLLSNIEIQLTYRLAGFSDKDYLKIFTEKTSPNSNNTSLLLPDESYEVFLYNNEIFDQVEYSSVIIQKTVDGFAVYGNSKLQPYFTIFTSIPNGNFKKIKVGNTEVRISSDFSDTEVKIPYGYVFTNTSTLSDFLISYGRWLESKGYQFENRENDYLLDWSQMIREALYWSQQGWRNGSIINLNPNADKLHIEKEKAVVAPILGQGADDFILNQNLKGITNDRLVFNRIDNVFEVKTIDENSISYINAKFTSYEHVLVFDNVSIFNDLIYDPSTGSRQQRLKINGFNTGDWTGQVEAQGFVFNIDNIDEWTGTRSYSKGDIVLYKNQHYSALEHVDPSATFNYSSWSETEYDEIKKGLLPNLSLKSDQIKDYYNSNVANLENDADQLGFGLIGFNKRSYLENMNLDDISQVNVYENYISNKGTKRAVDLFKSAKLEKELTNYSIFENWAVKQGIYGGNANRSYIELELNENKLSGNPSTVTLVENGATSTADQSVELNNIYRQSYKVTLEDGGPLSTIYSSQVNDLGLPTAGYVNIDDINFQAFDLDDLGVLTPYLDQLQEGTTIWVAKDNSHNWNIYRVSSLNQVLTTANDNLDGTSTLTFNAPHQLLKNDLVVIKYFDVAVDFAYRVISTPAIDKITVKLTLPTDTDTITNNGLLFKLNSVRVTQPSDVLGLPFANSLNTGNRVWVDNNGQDEWTVLEKVSPFTSESSLVTNTVVTDTNFGSSVAQNKNNLTALVGDTLNGAGRGAVYSFVKTADNVYAENSILSLASTTGVTGYGNDIAFADESYAVAGASTSNSGQGYVAVIKQPNSNLLIEHQLLVTPDGNPTAIGRFGDAVTISQDGRWIYVGAPGKDTVYGYQRVDRQIQQARFIGDGSTRGYNISTDIISSGNIKDNIAVVVDNAVLADSAYTFAGNIVTLDTAPASGKSIIITRNETKTLTGDGSTKVFNISGLFTIDGLHSIQVFVDSVLQRPELDYSYEADSSLTFAFTTAPADSASITIRSADYFEHVVTIAGTTGERFGDSVATTTDGRQIIVGAPLATSGAIDQVGKVYVYDRDVQRFQQTVATNKTFTTDQTPQGRAEVYVNGVYQTNSTRYIGGTYTFATKTATLATAPALGDFIDIETNNIQLIDTIEMTSKNQGALFGNKVKICPTNCSVYASAPASSQEIPEGGSVTRAVNQSRLYGTITGTVATPTVTSGHKIRINNYLVTFTSTTLAQVVIDINNANIPNVIASATSDSKLNIALVNAKAGPVANKLNISPAADGLAPLTALGLDIFVVTQTITNPYPKEYTNFGESIAISSDALTLVVGSPNGASNLEVTLDAGTTTLDSDHTEIRDIQTQSGVVYTFDYLSSANDSTATPGQFVFGQQVVDKNVSALTKFGQAVDYKSGKLLITSPGHKNASSQVIGRLSVWNNPLNQIAWKVIREEEKVVDIALLNSAFIYDKNDKKVKTELDFVDPIQGKILGAVKQNLDIIGAEDPASYNVGTVNNNGMTWNEEYIGYVWWNTTNARFINHYQGDTDYRSKIWNQLFVGSSVDIYQWVESSQLPEEYTGPGTVFSTSNYSTNTRVSSSGNIEIVYYFWVKDIPSVIQGYNKTLSVKTMSEYILDPKASGIAYMAPIASGSVAIYNAKEFLSGTDRILHVEFDKISTDNNVHVEYELIKAGDPNEFLSTRLYRKLIDSFAGTDSTGLKVPDTALGLAESYGIEYRPRQSMFADRFTALRNYITRANSVFAKNPLSEMRTFTALNSQESEPIIGSGAWDKRVLTYDELTYQNLILVPTGYKYLVASDSQNNNLWTIYEVQADDSLLLSRVQNFKTSNYWSFIDWYATGYSELNKPINEVATYSRLSTIESTTSIGDVVRVTANSNGKFENYARTATGWDRICLEDGTIAISKSVYDYSIGRNGFDVEVFDAQYFDAEPVIETRQIITAINDELLINELAIERINLITLMFEYIKSEQQSVNWLVKTSLVDVEHTLRDLQEFDIFQTDNQEFVEKYINEVKPYHVQVKEFNLKYQGEELFQGDTTDFDLPSYYDNTLRRFVSPKLSDDGLSGSFPSTDPIWSTGLYSQWNANHSLSIDSVTVVNGGSGYITAPAVTVTGTATTPATFKAIVNTAGAVTSVEVVTAGVGYTTTPTLTISGSGTGATAIAVTSPGTVRSYKTAMKYDRYEYQTEIVDWTANTVFQPGDLVRNNNKVYEVKNEEDSSLAVQGATFDPDDFVVVDPGTLSGVNRTMGLYVPAVNEPGLDLGLLISGTDYPGVQMSAPLYSQNTGYDIGNFDVNPFDNLDFGPEGEPSYSESILDTKYDPGDFTDTYLGTLASDINVSGGAFIDTYSSHSPQELIPGSVFDTLNMKVFTRPGFDYDADGHSGAFGSENFVYDGTAEKRTINFAKLTTNPFAVRAVNVTTGLSLRFEYVLPAVDAVDYNVDWLNKTLTFTGTNISSGDILRVESYGIGGGNQLWVDNYSVTDYYVDASTLVHIDVPVNFEQIYEAMIKCNGSRITNYTFTEVNEYTTRITFGTSGIGAVKYFGTAPLVPGDYIHIAILGYEGDASTLPGYITHDESLEQTSSHPNSQIINATGAIEYSLTQDFQKFNPYTAIVEVDGRRLTPPEALQFTSDGSSAGPYHLNLTNWSTSESLFQSLIADNDVHVFVNDTELKLYEDFTISPIDSSSVRFIAMTEAPVVGAKVTVFVETSAEYKIDYTGELVSADNKIVFNSAPTSGSRIVITTDNNTSELDLINRAFKGPTSTGVTAVVAYDSDGYDETTFDETTASSVDLSLFDLDRVITRPDRLQVTVNGLRKYYGRDWQLNQNGDTKIEFLSSAIGALDVVVVRMQSENIVPDRLDFAVFKDMRDANAIYNINKSHVTTVTTALTAIADEISVLDATKLSKPDLNNNIFGIIMIDGERITYRTLDVTNNKVSGLRRGTAGTAASSHDVGAIVYDYSVTTYLNFDYAKTVYNQPTIDDGSTITNGKALQNTNTVPAKFLRGQ